MYSKRVSECGVGQCNGLAYRTVNGFGISASPYEILQIQIQPISHNQLILFA